MQAHLKLDGELNYWIVWWEDLISDIPPRELRLHPSSCRPIFLYTDGAESAARGRTICGVIFSPLLPRAEFFRYTLPEDILKKWIEKDTMINQVEACAGVVAFDTWPHLLRDCELIHFIDSNTSLSSIVNGWSRHSDTCKIVGTYWKKACLLKCFPWLERVESHSNVADGPTKDNLALVQALDAREATPVVSGL